MRGAKNSFLMPYNNGIVDDSDGIFRACTRTFFFHYLLEKGLKFTPTI
jgi:hypothetical protein